MGVPVVVIGAGVGGLTCAAYLTKAGYDVTVLERQRSVGGRCSDLLLDGHRFDAGASMLMLVQAVSEIANELEIEIPLDACEPRYRLFFAGCDRPLEFDRESFETVEKGSWAQFEELQGELAHSYDYFWGIRSAAPAASTLGIGLLRALARAPLAVATLSVSSLLDRARARFSDPRLLAAATFEIGFLGEDPSLPHSAMLFGCLSADTHARGVFYPRGGMARIPEALADKLHVELGQEVVQVLPGLGVRTRDGRFYRASCVVDAADFVRDDPGTRYSISSVNFYWVYPKGALPELSQHNIFFPQGFATRIETAVSRLDTKDPFFYLHVIRTENATLVTALIPVPPDVLEPSEAELREAVRSRVRAGSPLAEEVRTPRSWEDLGLRHGSIIGPRHFLGQMAFMRRPFSQGRGLYTAGSRVHPGTGVPTAMLSGRLVAEAVKSGETSVLDNVRMSSTFGAASYLVPRRLRTRLRRLYRLFRLLDDLVDEAPGGADGAVLARELLAAISTSPDPGLREVASIGVPERVWRDFMAALDDDAAGRAGLELDVYCDGIAGGVGEAVSLAIGMPGSARGLREMGRGLQLVNMLRDRDRDKAAGRRSIVDSDVGPTRSAARALIARGLESLRAGGVGAPWRLLFAVTAGSYEAMGHGGNRLIWGLAATLEFVMGELSVLW